MEHDDRIPSMTLDGTSSDGNWIYCYTRYDYYSKKGGKWLFFVDRLEVDATWDVVKDLLRLGKLGIVAKVSTAKPSAFETGNGKHVICVYTDDVDDASDIARVAYNLLSGLPDVETIQYKSDRVTKLGIYEWNYPGPACKYTVTRKDIAWKSLDQFIDHFTSKGIDAGYNEDAMLEWKKEMVQLGFRPIQIPFLHRNADGTYYCKRPANAGSRFPR